MHTVEFFSAVLLVSRDPERLMRFYRDVLGFPLKEERHGDTDLHYGCELGDIHFAIHPAKNFEGDASSRTGSVRLAFTIFDMATFLARLADHGVAPIYAPQDVGFAVMTALRDPDGNYLEFTDLSEKWYHHLEERRNKGHDMLARWRAHRGKSKQE